MPGNRGRHRIPRPTLIATGAFALALAVGALAVVTTAGRPGDASADPADPSFYVDILKVKPNVTNPPAGRNASTGTFTVDCGRNENGHFNPDNFIAQPGVRNGAQHLHDYVGNLSTNAASTDQSLAAAGTTCHNGDRSAYFWPVIRIDTADDPPAAPPQKPPAAQAITCPDVASKLPAVPDQAKAEVDRNLTLLKTQIDEANNRLATSKGQGGPNFVQNAILGPLKDKRVSTIDRIAIAIGRTAAKPQGLEGLAPCGLGAQAATSTLPGADANNELPDNDGKIVEPAQVQITFRGSPAGPVAAMPEFLRVLYGDAKESTNGPKNARPSWTCTGFEDRITAEYPICPATSKVKRIHTFPDCWDGKHTDSADHRSHIVFAGSDGRCPQGFRAVPQLQISLTYDIPHDVQVKKQYKVDSFPQEHHNPLSDHDDFANVMSPGLMNQLVDCVNRNRACRA